MNWCKRLITSSSLNSRDAFLQGQPLRPRLSNLINLFFLFGGHVGQMRQATHGVAVKVLLAAFGNSKAYYNAVRFRPFWSGVRCEIKRDQMRSAKHQATG